MLYNLEPNKEKLNIFLEKTKRRNFVGTLSYSKKKDKYCFQYCEKYRYLDNPFPLGMEFNIHKSLHWSKKGELFDFFVDRIPLRRNPAYPDYCRLMEISVEEKNPIILLGSIGSRGPSNFIFEPIYETEFSNKDILEFRKQYGISQNEFSEAFDIPLATLQNIETNKSNPESILTLIEIYLTFPKIAYWKLQQTKGRIHYRSLEKLFKMGARTKKSD